MTDLFDRHKVIDADSHVSEPGDVWTSRVASKWGNAVPHIRNLNGKDIWFIGDRLVLPTTGPGASLGRRSPGRLT
jgi:hypothetical protein